jgi:hypothetical protein
MDDLRPQRLVLAPCRTDALEGTSRCSLEQWQKNYFTHDSNLIKFDWEVDFSAPASLKSNFTWKPSRMGSTETGLASCNSQRVSRVLFGEDDAHNSAVLERLYDTSVGNE